MKECPRCGACTEDAAITCSADGATLVTTLEGPPLIDGKFRLERRVGKGGMGVVYKARHLTLDKIFALKLVHPKLLKIDDLQWRFWSEAKALGRLNHHSVVAVSDFGLDLRARGTPYLVMEYVEGKKLTEMLREGPLPIETALEILDAVARAIDHAHGEGIVHRDLKPDNVMLRRSAERKMSVKVLDFGVARILGEALAELPRQGSDDATWSTPPPSPEPLATMPGILLGTPGYMPPEIVNGRCDAASDIYAFGVIAYEAIAGRPPFSGSPENLIRQHVESTVPAPSAMNPALSSEMDRAILRPLEKDPALRPDTAKAVVEGIRRALAITHRREWKRKELPRRLLAAAALAAIAALLALSGPQVGPLPQADRAITDLWVWLSPPRLMSDRLAVVLLPDDFWRAEGVEDADEVGRFIDRVFECGARGVGIDLILPDRFGRSAGFAQAVLRHADRIVLSAGSLDDGPPKGAGCVSGYVTAALGADLAGRLYGRVALLEDPDGIVRRYELSCRDASGHPQPTLAGRTLAILSEDDPGATIGIDFRADWRPRLLRWAAAQKAFERRPSPLAGRMVLLGSESALGEDVHRVPHPRALPGRISGVVLHALAIDTVIMGSSVEEPPAAPSAGVLGAISLLTAFAVLWIRRSSLGLLTAFLTAIVWVMGGYLLFRVLHLAIPVMMPIVGLALAGAGAFALRRLLPSHPSREV